MKTTHVLTALFLAAGIAQASVLTFEGTGTNVEIPGNWGSNIAADGTGFNVSNGTTPNVALGWSVGSGGTKEERWDFYNDSYWTGVAQLNDFDTGVSYYLTFTPDTGYGVLVDSFVFNDYAGWQGGNDFSWNLYEDVAGGTLIASGSATTTDGQNLVINTGMATNHAGTVVLELVNNETSDEGSDQALDDIAFRQVFLFDPPEPPMPVIPFSGEIRFLSMNTWQQGGNVSGGLDKIGDVVIGTGADIAVFSETSSSSFPDTVLANMAGKGVTNYFAGHTGGDVSIITRFPILDSTSVTGSIKAFRLQLPSGHPLTVCVAHLDYTWYALYLPRGYWGGSPNWGMIDTNPADGVPDYVSDLAQIHAYDMNSTRDEAIDAFIAFATPLTDAGEDVILAGDFNDASHLDWVDATRNMFGHNDLVIPWHGSTNLAGNGWVDSYRDVHPNPVTHPGITWPSEAFGKGSTAWIPASDERDRIDFIYYNKTTLAAQDAAVVGSRAYFEIGGVKADIVSDDTFLMETSDWPSDHKAVMTTFEFADADEDGIPDYWELRYGMNPTNSADALIDSDLDDANNLKEYRSRTNPTNATSLLKVEMLGIDPAADGAMDIQWQSDNELQYRISESTNLVDWASLQDNIIPTPPLNAFTYALTNAAGRGFIRIEVL